MIKTEFNNLVTEQKDALRKYASRFTKNEEDANDLVQDTILKAITYYEKFKKGTNFSGWLYTIMKNTFINNYRRRARKLNLVAQSSDISYANLVHSSSKNRGEEKIILDDINFAISQLRKEYYVPFTMHFEGYRYHEIADHLAIPIGTVKTRIHVARKSLKRSLDMYAESSKDFQIMEP